VDSDLIELGDNLIIINVRVRMYSARKRGDERGTYYVVQGEKVALISCIDPGNG